MDSLAATPSQDRTIFLSFTSLDREAARAVVAGLRAASIDVWWDEGGIGWGDDWQDKIEQTLTRCAAYVILLGRGGVRRWVKPELGVAFKRHVDDGLPILPLLLDGVSPESIPPFLSLKQARRLPADPGTFDFAALAAELRAATAPLPPAPLDRCPFPGLVPFEEDAADFFLGRQADTLALLERLGRGVDGVQRRWLQVEGPSGVGKSSLVRAGQIPAVRAGWAEEGPIATHWSVIVLRPGNQPLEALAAALERALVVTQGAATLFQRIEALRRRNGEETDLSYLLKVAFPEGARLLLVIDQFEELFTLNRDPELLGRLDALLATALDDMAGPLYLVSTIRSDFLLRIGELPRLQELLNSHAGRYDLRPLSLNGLREVVRIPAQRAGLRWSEHTLPNRIVDDAIRERSPLPLVANLLQLLWEEANKRGDHILLADDYQTLGGVPGALAKGAQRLLDSLGSDGRERARRLLLALVKPGKESQDTKQPIPRSEALAAAGGGVAAEQVLNRLSGLRGAGEIMAANPYPRLVVISEAEADRPGEASHRVDLAHEALLRVDAAGKPYWEALHTWVREARVQLEARDRLEDNAKLWVQAGKPRFGDLLARGGTLRDFRHVENPAPLAVAYLKASRLRQRLRRLVGGLGLAVLGGLVSSYTLHERGLDFYSQWAWFAIQSGNLFEPEMVMLEGGTFRMGCLEGQDCGNTELPVREVTVKGFALGRYEVTCSEFVQFALERGNALPWDSGWGRGRRPVIYVSWDDAVAYAKWLSKRTGKRYRLPTEAEWEYATRAGTATRWSFGDQESHLGNSAWFSGNSGYQPHPVGEKEPNPWGLYDMHGNVWEWVEDCWHESYKGAPTDGTAWREEGGGDCGQRVVRGGSWHDVLEYLRSATRGRYGADGRDDGLGFRLAQDL